MVTKIKIIFWLLFFILTSCSQFQGIFSKNPNSSRPVSQKSQKKDYPDIKKQETSVTVPDFSEPIVTKQGVYYYLKEGDNLAKISRKYRVDWEAIAQINNVEDDQLVVGRRLFIPHRKNLENFGIVPQAIKKARKGRENPIVTAKKRDAKLDFLWPVEGGAVTSGFGNRRGRPHDAIDIAAKMGTAVLAAESGQVIFAKRFSGYGNLVVVKHSGEFYTVYAHNQKILVNRGKKVKRGQKIALVGRTGRATGPHLHFEIRQVTTALDPLKFFPDKKIIKRRK